MITAVDFGLEQKEDTGADDFLGLMGGSDDEGGMMMDSDEEEEEEEEKAPAASSTGGYKLAIEITSCNVKRIDTKAEGIEKPNCQAIIALGDQEYKTKILPGLDPQFDENTTFTIESLKDRLSAKFFMNQGEKQIGDEQFFFLDKLIKGVPTYKGLIVPGGK